MCWCDPQKRTPWCDNCHTVRPDLAPKPHRLTAKALRNRFNDIFEIQRDNEAFEDWPAQSVEEQRLKALFGVVGDIVIWIEEQEKNNEPSN